MSTLDQRLLTAHAADDHAALVTLYTQAADFAASAIAQAFYLTQAYVFALEIGHHAALSLRQRLKDMGREA